MPAALPGYRHIIWDWNGTLLNDVALSVDVMDGMLRRRGLPPLDLERYHAVFDFPVCDYYRRLGLDASEEGFRALSVEFIAAYDARRFTAALHDQCEALLAAVAARGMTQSILSAYRHETLCEIVDHFGLRRHFVQLNGLDNIYAHSKAELGRACLAALGIPPAEVLFVGDTLHDLDVANAIGVDSFLVSHGHHPAARLRARSPRVFANLKSIADELGIELASAPAAARDCAPA